MHKTFDEEQMENDRRIPFVPLFFWRSIRVKPIVLNDPFQTNYSLYFDEISIY